MVAPQLEHAVTSGAMAFHAARLVRFFDFDRLFFGTAIFHSLFFTLMPVKIVF
tara:strand:- start:3020 stop:3178 length:159 start_codon:yes stop_codon:yes gene_type:complete